MNLTDHIIKELFNLDHKLRIYTGTNGLTIKNKYGEYYTEILDQESLFLALVHMRACMLNKESNNGR